MESASNIKNIIFDLGGVIMNLDVDKTILAFKDLGMTDVVNDTNLYYKNPIFNDFETGKISETGFLDELGKLLGPNATHKKIKQAWNAMILDIPKDRINFTLNLKDKYRVFLLSNTNSIHQTKFESEFKQQNDFLFAKLFEKIYYSHKLGMRKPGEEIFNFVIKDSKLKAKKTLFIDDSDQNIATAKKLGIKTVHLQDAALLTNLDIK
ncbi:MAG: hypothetical protein B6I20_07015 [Bacteroidetes bacterium 4572_117]|nr:MAG: hypothetical protein B6I20_07015 [Bacteroidetes bacterium 4572_117]